MEMAHLLPRARLYFNQIHYSNDLTGLSDWVRNVLEPLIMLFIKNVYKRIKKPFLISLHSEVPKDNIPGGDSHEGQDGQEAQDQPFFF